MNSIATNRRSIGGGGVAIALAPVLAVLLVTAVATAQSPQVTPAGNLIASAAEITAFMQSFEKDPKAVLKLSSNPKRVPLLLGASQRDPSGPWVGYLEGLCYQADRATAFHLPPTGYAAVYARAIEYLTTARTTTAKALAADPQNRVLKDNLAALDRSLAQARAESVARTNQTRQLVGLGSASNAPPRLDSALVGTNTAQSFRRQACGSSLKQIDLAKEMWKTDNNKPDDAAPTAAELAYYLPYRQFPKCPEGGTYTIGKLNQKPRCSVPGHELRN